MIFGPFIQKTSGRAPPVAAVSSFVKYWSNGVTSTVTSMFGLVFLNSLTMSSIAGAWSLFHSPYRSVTACPAAPCAGAGVFEPAAP